MEKVKSSNTLGGTGAKQPDKAGIDYGLSSLTSMDSSEGGMQVDSSVDSKTGNRPARPSANPTPTSASAKGKSFSIC